MHLANTNAAIWATGNGLVGTTLVIYLAIELGAAGIYVSLVLAAPRLVGLLRLASPALMTSGRKRKLVCLACYLASALVLALLPLVATRHVMALVGCWCLYHLLEYIGTVALWSWLGDWMPRTVRGRLIGWRERYLIAGRIVGVAVSISLDTLWRYLDPEVPRWVPLAWSASVGAAMMMLAVVPLFWLAPKIGTVPPSPPSPWRDIQRAFTDRAYRRLLLYSFWIALANGVTGTAQSLYVSRVLGFTYNQSQAFRSMMYAGQTAIAPSCGRWIDKFGPRRLMVAAQLVVATGPLFYFLASAEFPWWIVGAWIVWIAYAPLNVGLDTLKLRLIPTDGSAPPLAVYQSVSDLAHGATLIIGGYLFDQLTTGDSPPLGLYAGLFLVGWLLRSSAAPLAWRVPEHRAGGEF